MLYIPSDFSSEWKWKYKYSQVKETKESVASSWRLDNRVLEEKRHQWKNFRDEEERTADKNRSMGTKYTILLLMSPINCIWWLNQNLS